MKEICIQDLPADENIINSHVLYKSKVSDDMGLKLKTRNAPHGSEDSMENELRSNSSMFPAPGLRIIVSVTSLNGRRLSKINATKKFLRTCSAARDVYVLTPRKSSSRGSYKRLSPTTAYELCSANDNFQIQSGGLLHRTEFTSTPQIQQLFMLKKSGKLIETACKIVNDVLLACNLNTTFY